MPSDPHQRPTPHRRFNWALLLMIPAGVASAMVGIHALLVPSGLIDGGVTGVAMLVSRVTGLPLSLFLLIINAPFIVLAWRVYGRAFGIICVGSILMLAVALAVFEIPQWTQDKLLAAVFGGFFLGLGMGITIRSGGVLDGTEVLAVWVNQKTSLSIGDVILILNVVIFGTAALLIGIEQALYSMLAYGSAAKTVDYVLNGIEAYHGVSIISEKHVAIRERIYNELNRGVTIYQGRGGFSQQNLEILFCVTTRLEFPRLRSIIEDCDPNAFYVVYNLDDAAGGMTRRMIAR